MKYLSYILFLGIIFTGCQSNSGGGDKNKEKGGNGKDTTAMESKKESGKKHYDTVHYGEKINEKGAISLAQMMDSMGDKMEYRAKVRGQVTAVCQKKGCWMKMKRPDGESMRITFKDYGFFVPKDLSGGEVVMSGRAFLDTIPVKVRRHFARDEGKSEEEVKKITEPKTQIAFKAEGVQIIQ